MATVRQTNFSAGELSPLLWGRTDLSIYGKGLRRCRNFFISHGGAAVSRPGSTFVAECKVIADEAYTIIAGENHDRPVRLVSFIVGDNISCVIAFGELHARFYTRGQVIESAPGVPYELVTPYTAAELHLLRFAQVGDVLTIAHPSHAPAELRRTGVTNWSLEDIELTPPTAVMPDVGISAMPNPFNPGSPPELISTTPFMLLEPLPTPDPDHPVREWIWGFTAIMRRKSDGVLFESLMQVVKYSTDGVETYPVAPDQTLLTDHNVAVYRDMPVTLRRLTLNTIIDPDFETLSFRVYRGRGDVFGWVGDTRSREFIDVGDEPDWSIQPPLGTNPFRIVVSGFVAVMRPWTVAFFQERRMWGGAGVTGSNPYKQEATLFGSRAGDYFNHDTRLAMHVSEEAFVKEIAIQTRQRIRHMVTMDRLIVLTDSAARSVAGQDGTPLSYLPAHMPVVDAVGASHVRPLEVDKSVLFVRTKGTGARALVPSQREGGYEGSDISLVAEHMFIGSSREVIDWCHAEDPWGLVWAVRADGRLLSLTYTRGGWGWATHDTDGVFESICSVPEGDEDAVYVVVKRLINGVERRYIERFTSRHSRAPEVGDGAAELAEDGQSVITPPDFICVDSAVQYLGDEQPGSISGLGHLEGEEVFVVGQGMMPLGPFDVIDGAIDLQPVERQLPFNTTCLAGPKLLVHVGMLYTPELETLDDPAARMGTKVVERVGVEVDQSIGLEAGQDFDNLAEWDARTVEDGYDPLVPNTQLIDTVVEGTWGQTGRAAIRQTKPLPVTVVGISRVLERGSPD